MAEIISKNVSVGQCTVYSLQTKNTQGQDILLLHGARFQAATWKELTTLDRLDDAGYRPHAIDLPGFGKSPRCAVTHETVLQVFIQEQRQDQTADYQSNIPEKGAAILEEPDVFIIVRFH